jgi:signal transduction histidine kinase
MADIQIDDKQIEDKQTDDKRNDDKRTRALLVEDNPGDAFLVQEQLSRLGSRFDVESAEDLSAAMRSVSLHQPDVVLLDLDLPDSHGTETVRKMIHKIPHVPVLVLTGRNDEEMGVRAVQEGAQDYLIKGSHDGGHLIRAIKYAIERQSLLHALHQSREQQLHFKDQLLSHVSHELRSPLTCIHQFVTILLDGLAGPLATEQRDCLDTVLKSANQLRSMINDLLETATIEAGKLKLEFRCVVMNELIKQAGEMLQATATAKAIALSWDLTTEPLLVQPLLVHADPHRVLQVLINLIENALKFTPKAGQVTVKAEIRGYDPGFVLVTVKDTGCGITDLAKPLVFERLFQEENATDKARKGLGLGLSICQDLVTRQGGRIWVESEVGRGSTFFFTLPVFSLSKLLLPIVSDRGAVRQNISLITAKLAPIPITSALEAWANTRRQFLDVVQRCILPDKDLLLPSMGHPEMGEFFFIVAGTDASGAEVLLKRIREQTMRCSAVSANSVLNVSSQPVEVSPSSAQPLEDQVEALASRILQATSKAMNKGEFLK